MSSTQERTRPTPIGFLRYLGGRPLPESLRGWVLRDVTGSGYTRRYITRGVLPLMPILIAFFFIPTPLIYRLCMVAILLIPLIYFQIALTPFYRRHLLLTNGLDPELVSARKQRRKAATKADYDAIYGDRSEP